MIPKMIKEIESDNSKDEDNEDKSSTSFIAKKLGDFFFWLVV